MRVQGAPGLHAQFMELRMSEALLFQSWLRGGELGEGSRAV